MSISSVPTVLLRQLWKWTLAGSPWQELHSGGEGDDCVLLGGMSSSWSPRPWPRLPTTQPYGDKTARAREEGHEDKHDAPRRQKPPPPQPELFDLSVVEEPGGCGLTASPAWGRRSQSSGTPWSTSSTVCRHVSVSRCSCAADGRAVGGRPLPHGEARERGGQDRGPDPRGCPCQHCWQGGLVALGQGHLLFLTYNEEEEKKEEEEATENGSSGWRRPPTSSRCSCCRKLWRFRSCSSSTSWGSSSSWTRWLSCPLLCNGRSWERSWCPSATDHGFRGGDSACAYLRGADRGVPAPQITWKWFILCAKWSRPWHRATDLRGYHQGDQWVLFLDKVILPVVMQDMFSGLDVQKTVDVSQLQFLTVLAEFGDRGHSTGAVLGRVVHGRPGGCGKPLGFRRCRSWTRVWRARVVRQVPGLDLQKTVDVPQLQFANQLTWGKPVEIHRRSSWTWDSRCRQWRCLKFSSTPEFVDMLSRNRDRYALCKLCRLVPETLLMAGFMAWWRWWGFFFASFSREGLSPARSGSGADVESFSQLWGHRSCACEFISFSRIVRVWTNTFVNVVSKTTTTTIIQSGEAPF